MFVDADAPDSLPAAEAAPATTVAVDGAADLGPDPGVDAADAPASPTAGGVPSDEAARRRRSRRSRLALEWGIVIVVAVAVAISVRAFVVQSFWIPSASMEPTLMVGDRILVDKLSYHLHDVHRGDIVVFGRPPGEPAVDNIQDLVKRVIGLPGETISSQGGSVYINGKKLKEPWLPAGTPLGPPITTFRIPANDYFVMGDNRSNSEDSRFFGPIPRSLIVGRVFIRIWPLDKIHIF